MPGYGNKPSWNERAAYVLEKSFMQRAGNGLIVYEVLHAKTHNGDAYSFHTLATDVANNGSIDIVILPSVNIHLVFASAVTASSRGFLYESITYDDQTGTSLTSYNRDRVFGTDDGVATLLQGPDITDTGTELSADLIPGGEKNKSIGSTTGSFPEWILKADVPYLIRITNVSGANEDISISGHFYVD